MQIRFFPDFFLLHPSSSRKMSKRFRPFTPDEGNVSALGVVSNSYQGKCCSNWRCSRPPPSASSPTPSVGCCGPHTWLASEQIASLPPGNIIKLFSIQSQFKVRNKCAEKRITQPPLLPTSNQSEPTKGASFPRPPDLRGRSTPRPPLRYFGPSRSSTWLERILLFRRRDSGMK